MASFQRRKAIKARVGLSSLYGVEHCVMAEYSSDGKVEFIVSPKQSTKVSLYTSLKDWEMHFL